MRIKISLYYYTQWGQTVSIYGSAPELGDNCEDKAIGMLYTDNGLWHIDIEMSGSNAHLEYRFLVKENGIVIRRESGSSHMLTIEHNRNFDIRDVWQDVHSQHYLYTSAFTSSFFSNVATVKTDYYANTLLLKVNCPYVKSDEELVIIGEGFLLGNWDCTKGLSMQYSFDNQWELSIDADAIDKELEYKIAIRNTRTQSITHWEIGDNRTLHPINEANVVKVQVINYSHEPMYWRASGVAIPIFSLRSESCFGIGDFADLRMMVDWAVKSGQKVIQLLPINDTTTTCTWTDSYPYNCISNYALHPLYLGLSEYPLDNEELNAHFRTRAKAMNDFEKVDYESVFNLKSEYIKELYKEQGALILGEYDYIRFFEQNKNWLFPYACFCYFRDKYCTADMSQWGEYSRYDYDNLNSLAFSDASVNNSLQFTYLIQFLLDQQLAKAKKYAHENGVILKGDIPIGINRNSVEAWIEPHLFNLDSQTGAPPDDFSANGQNWGFPTYNWAEMSKDDYRWWKKRFQKMADYFDAYRIDHILGFFRIWEIPIASVQGILGCFNPALPLSDEDIQAYGFDFDDQAMTNARVNKAAICEFFGEYEQEVLANYLQQTDEGNFILNEDCNTQRKIEKLFANKLDEKPQLIKLGLYEICNEVLFVRDKKEPCKFHPRISAYQSYAYKALNQQQQDAYYRLYEDFFYHRHNQFWGDQAMSKLPVLVGSTSMLVCGEDLGMIPGCVPQVMTELQILSLEIERMPKELGVEFGNTTHYPFMSVCTTSTHDMSPIRQWWEEDPEATQRYYNLILHREGTAPQVCSSDICWQILSNHLHSPSMLCIIPLQDWLSFWDDLRRPDAKAERINIPSNSRHYWNYRMHLRLEDLIVADNFNDAVKKMIVDAQRN